MTLFTLLFVSTLIVQPASASVSIRSVVNSQHRGLSVNKIAGYQPGTEVADESALDMDQYFMEMELAKKTENGNAKARAIYEEGGNSLPYAQIKLNDPISSTISKDTILVGTDIDGRTIGGKVFKDAFEGQKLVKIQYNTSEVQGIWAPCRVGALRKANRETSGCLMDAGSITVGGNNYTYEYDSLTNNENGRTLQGLSNSVESTLKCSIGCPFTDAKMFADYYGQADYGDGWIKAAFEGGATPFSNGNANFSSYGYGGRSEAIKKGSVYMNVFMHVIRKFESAITKCNPNQSSAFKLANMWDKGVAFYSGSMEGTDGLSTGYMLHQLADKHCQSFKTCGIDGDLTSANTSYVNHELLRLFENGKDELLNSACGAAEKTLRSITKLMYVPLIQGVLRQAHKVDKLGQTGVKQKAAGAVFAASVLPRIHAVNASAAEVIYDNMKVGALSTSFADVKTAFESVYPKVGISCRNIGGLVDDKGTYYEGAIGCISVPTKPPSMAPTSTPKSHKHSSSSPTALPLGESNTTSLSPTSTVVSARITSFVVFLGLLY